METPVPMDRVISGDVGFGKTEIGGPRGVQGRPGRQAGGGAGPDDAAGRSSTCRPFAERMAGFPVTVKGLSPLHRADEAERDGPRPGRRDRRHRGRHPPAAADRRHVEGPRPRDHRRGAAIRREAQGVFITAAARGRRRVLDERDAIPRTLEMSLAGIREMSTIATPRRRIATPRSPTSAPYDEKQVSASIRRELLRDGQVFYVHNRVSTIDRAARSDPRARARGAGGDRPRPDATRTCWNARSTGSGTTSSTCWSARRS